MSTMTATARVFATPELVEHIISFVPPQHMVNLLRVCKRTRQIVKGTKHLRRPHCASPVKLMPRRLPLYRMSSDCYESLKSNPAMTEMDKGEATLWINREVGELEALGFLVYFINFWPISEPCWKKVANQQVFNPPLSYALIRIESDSENTAYYWEDFERQFNEGGWLIFAESGITFSTVWNKLYDLADYEIPNERSKGADVYCILSAVVELVD